MTSLLGIHSLSKSFGTQKLFENISFNICSGDKIGLLGPNGAGKTTLLKIIMDLEQADEGNISRKKSLRLGYASQSPEFASLSLEEILVQDMKDPSDPNLRTRARIILGKMQFSDPNQNASVLSGGRKKRLDIARALMHEPDLLILDEPTNHLDLEGIIWLEKFLSKENISYILVSHDRYFLDKTVNKIVEINHCYPEGIFVSGGNFSEFLVQKKDFLEAQAQRQKGLASTVRQEIEWLRKSPKARTTKSQSRVKNAHKLIEELSEIKQRNRVSKVDVDFSASERETRKLLIANNLSKTLGGKELFKGVNLTLSPGSRLGIVGKNGTGKTTLLKILAKQLAQDMGTVKYAEDLRLVYFDQHREKINPNIPLREALSPVGDTVIYNGKPIHVNGWAQKFLFSSDRLELPVRCLSGGERARILIAKLMLEPADILFLDEPTNDLDIQTLEVIEESLNEFPGAIVLISHDRCMMDRVCTQILGLGEGEGGNLYADYRQWELATEENNKKNKDKLTEKEPGRQTNDRSLKKLSYNEQRELAGMEKTLTENEELLASLADQLENCSDPEKSLELYKLLAEAEEKMEKNFLRWEELTNRSGGL